MLAAIFIFGGQNNYVAAQDLNFQDKFIQLTTYDEWYGVVDSDIDFLALRSGPSVRYPELARIPPGASIIIYQGGADYFTLFDDYDNDFIGVIYNGIKGYSHGAYITRLGYKGGRA